MNSFEDFKLSIIGSSIYSFPIIFNLKVFKNGYQGTFRMCSFFLKSK